MSAGEKRLSAGDRAAARIAASLASRAIEAKEPAAAPVAEPPDDQRETAERGVLGRLDRIVGSRARVDRLELDPRRVRVWSLQGRLQDALTEDSVADVVRSIQEYGQFAPAIVRPVADDPAFSHEVIDGSRRRMACELLNKKLIAFSSELTDLQAAMMSQSADDQVKHSPYEVGLRWQGWLQAGLAKDAAELADRIRVDRSQMSRHLNVARVPRAFLRCFGDHVRVPKAIYLRLASLVAKAKQANRLDETTADLQARATLLMEEGKGAKEATAALTEAETALRPRREPAKLQPIERRDSEDRLRLSVVPGGSQVGIKLARALPAKTQVAFAEAVADFASAWLAKN